jgi:hypothetical protein
MIFPGDIEQVVGQAAQNTQRGGRVMAPRRSASYHSDAHAENAPVLEGHRPTNSGPSGLFSSYIPRTTTPKEERHPVTDALLAPLVCPASLYDLTDPALRS